MSLTRLRSGEPIFALAHWERCKCIASLLMLVAWELLNNTNASIFNNVSTMPTIVFARMKVEATNWVIFFR
jgi:hypothetical protein